MQIMIALENKEAQQLLAFALESELDVSVIETSSTIDAVSRIQKEEDTFDFILVEGSEKSGSVINYISVNRVKKPVIVVVLNESKRSGTFGIRNLVGVVGGEKIVDEILQLLNLWIREQAEINPKAVPIKTLQKTPTAARAKNAAPAVTKSLGSGAFSRINTNLLLRVSPLKAPVYIKLSDTKFVRLFQEGDVFDVNDLERYMNTKKIDYFYLFNAEVGEFISRLRDDLMRLISEAGKSGIKLAKINSEIGESVHETVKELITNLGVTPEVQQVVKSSMDMAVKAMGKSPRLSSIIERLKKNKDKYISSHSMMLGEIACSIAAAAGWHSDNTFYKLNLAAFLHDITLKNDRLATVQSIEELTARKLEFTDQEYKDYREHPAAAAELARQFTEIPPDVDVIIAQHHELPDGSGFPRGLTQANISPLAASFLVAHDLLLFIMAHEQGWKMKEFLESVEKKYAGGNFKKIIKVMSEMKI